MQQNAYGLAVVSLLVSMLGVLSQVVLYRRSGGRLSVRFTPAVMTHLGTVVTAPRGGWRSLSEPPLDEHDLWVDIAQITVGNLGRTVVWVSHIGLDFGASGRLGHRSRTVMTVRPIVLTGGVRDNSPLRLEPGQAVAMYVTVRDQLAWAACTRRRDRLLVRATLRVAGVRVRRSSRRHGLRVGAHAALYPFGPDNKRVRVFAELLHAWPTSDVSDLYEAWLQVFNALRGASHDGNVDHALAPFIDAPLRRGLIARQLEDVFRNGPADESQLA